MGDTTEQYYAEMEAARNDAESKYFEARPQLDRGGPLSVAFRAGFERAFAALWKPMQKLDEIARDNGDSAVMRNARLDSIKEIIDTIENRAMAADGPVTNTRHEMTDEELRRIYRLAGGAAQS